MLKNVLENKYIFSIIIPAFNEEFRIKNAVEKINAVLCNISHEIIIINDGSTDTTWQILKELGQRDHHLQTINLEVNKGKGFAIKTGFLKAQGRYVLMTDADLSTPIETLFNLGNELKEYDILIGSRLLNSKETVLHGPWSRKILRRISRIIRKILFNIEITDTQCGFKIFTNEAAKNVASRMTTDRYGADLEKIIIAKGLGYKIKEIPVSWIFDEKYSKINLIKDSYKTTAEWIKIKINLIKGKY